MPPIDEASLLDFGDPVELVALEVELLDELLLLRDLDREGDLLEVLPGEGDRLPDLDFVFFLAFGVSAGHRSAVSVVGVVVVVVVVVYPVSFG